MDNVRETFPNVKIRISLVFFMSHSSTCWTGNEIKKEVPVGIFHVSGASSTPVGTFTVLAGRLPDYAQLPFT